MAKTNSPKFYAIRGLLILLILITIHFSLPEGPLTKPVEATTDPSLGLWSSTTGSSAVLDPTLTANSFVKFNVNATGELTINGFDITVRWDPAILAGENSTLQGGIFDIPDCCLVSNVTVRSDHVRMAGVLNFGTRVPANGVLFTFTLKIQTIGSSALDIDEAVSVLTLPTSVKPSARDGFFSNNPVDGDLMLVSLSASSESVPLGDEVQISVGIRNLGAVIMTGVVVSVVANNTTPINSTAVGTVTPGSAQTVTLVWNTTGFSLGLYNLTATVTTTAQDAFLADNSIALEHVTVVIHDVGVVSLTAPSSALVNSTVQFSLTLENRGTVEDIANVSIIANTTLVRFTSRNSTSLAFTLAPGEIKTIPGFAVEWNTTLLAAGRYSLKAIAAAVEGESNLDNNILVDGTIAIKEKFDHDLQITGSLPSEALTGQNVTIFFQLKNNGIFDEDYTVGVFLGDQSIFQQTELIQPFTSRTVLFAWNTKNYPSGSYVLKANVTMTVPDEDLSNNEISNSFTLTLNQRPVAAFVVGPTTADAGSEFTFNATSSSDIDGVVVSYGWDFGDGQTESGSVVKHVYTNPGSYTVVLTVTDNAGGSDTSSLTVEVKGGFPLLLVYGLAAVVAVAAALAGAWLFLARRKKIPQKSPAQPVTETPSSR